MNTTNINFDTLTAMPESEARMMCKEVVPIKGHLVYLIENCGYFGYSAIVYCEGRQIKWANDYELHHNGKSQDDLRTLYLEKLDKILYTEEELAKPIHDYMDFERRRKFITELMPLRRDFMSVFCCISTEEEKKAREKERAAHPVVCKAALGCFTEADKDFSEQIERLHDRLFKQLEDVANNYEYQFSAFYYELGNHEYHINTYQGDWDTLSAFGNIPWRGQGAAAREMYFKDLNFTETQIKAFNDARKKFLKDADENDWY